MEHIFYTFQQLYPRLYQYQRIEPFPLSIKLTDKRRPKYEWNAKRAEQYVKKNPHTRIAVVGNNIYVYDKETQIKLPMNAGVINKPRIVKLNGNTIMSGLTHQQRNTLFGKYKDALRPIIRTFEPVSIRTPIALFMQLELPLITRLDFDVDNLSWPIYKNIQDLMVQENIITDDTIEFVNLSCGMHIVTKDISEPILHIYMYGK
jgi:hypothetical protein